MVEQVEFLDTLGRRCVFSLSRSGFLEYYVDGRHKASHIKKLEPAGSTVAFDGKRLLSHQDAVTIREEETDEVVAKLMDLANKAYDASTWDMNATRCIVRVDRAEGLRAADDSGTSDPYVVVSIPGKPQSSGQTTNIWRTLDPVWCEYVEVHGYEPGDGLELRVMDYDYLTSDDWLGSATISGQDLATNRFTGTLALGDDGKHGAYGNIVTGTLAVQVWVATNDELTGDLAGELQEAMTDLSQRKTANGLGDDDSSTIKSSARKDVIKGLVAVLVGQNVKVAPAEVRAFAECYGFHGSDDEWACEFAELCDFQKWASGPDLEQFACWVDNDTMFGDDIVLGQVLDELKRRSSNPKKRPRYMVNTWQTYDKTDYLILRRPREQLVREAYSVLTRSVKADAIMASHDLWNYAQFCGFDGTMTEWTIEYQELMAEYGFSQAGPDLGQFHQIVDGTGDESSRCGDGELRELIDMFRIPGGEGRVWQSTLRDQIWLLHPKTWQARAQLPRRALIEKQFNIYDEDGDGFVGPDELRKFAEISGWRGSDDEWAVHYGEMVHGFNLNSRNGADLNQFEKIVDKKAGQGGIQAQDLVELIEDTAIVHSHKRRLGMLQSEASMVSSSPARSRVSSKSASLSPKMSRSYSRHLSKAMSKDPTWLPVSKNYEVVRSFCVFLHGRFRNPDQAFAAFSKTPFRRVAKAEFLAALDRLGFVGDHESLYRLLTLGGLFVVKLHINWAWNFLQGEDIVRARTRSHT